MTDHVARLRYSSDQIDKFLNRIEFPCPDRIDKLISHIASPIEQLQTLTQLQIHTLANVPFENLAIHYSPHHAISLDPSFLFDKIVERRRGGYCMENNCFFGIVLRTLNYSVRSVGARVSKAAAGNGEGYTGWSHMVNIVSVSGKKYQVDVGFGLNGPTQPILLEEGWETTSISPSGVRLVRDFIPDFRDKNEDQDKLWIFQHRAAPSEGWQPIYAFTEIEFIPQDYEISNFFTSTSRTSFFTSAIVVVKYLLDNLGKGQLIGSMSLMNGFAKRRMRGNTKLLTECKTEEERIRALRDYFGIEIKEDEKQGIKGLVTELKGK